MFPFLAYSTKVIGVSTDIDDLGTSVTTVLLSETKFSGIVIVK